MHTCYNQYTKRLDASIMRHDQASINIIETGTNQQHVCDFHFVVLKTPLSHITEDTWYNDTLQVHGRFATLPVRHLDDSPSGCFTFVVWRFATFLDVSPPVWKFVICDTVRTSLSSGGETSRWRTGKVAKRLVIHVALYVKAHHGYRLQRHR